MCRAPLMLAVLPDGTLTTLRSRRKLRLVLAGYILLSASALFLLSYLCLYALRVTSTSILCGIHRAHSLHRVHASGESAVMVHFRASGVGVVCDVRAFSICQAGVKQSWPVAGLAIASAMSPDGRRSMHPFARSLARSLQVRLYIWVSHPSSPRAHHPPIFALKPLNASTRCSVPMYGAAVDKHRDVVTHAR